MHKALLFNANVLTVLVLLLVLTVVPPMLEIDPREIDKTENGQQRKKKRRIILLGTVPH